MNMQQIMMQAKKLQGDMEKITKEINNKSFEYENENIFINVKGNYRLEKIIIKNEEILNDKELLEDIIFVGINDVLNKIGNEKKQKLGKYTNGLGGLF